MSLAIRTTTPPLPSGDSMSPTTLPVPGSAQLDPREAMIEGLTEQNESLLETFEKATQVFQQNQTQQKETIVTLAKTNEELQAALIASEGRAKEIELVHKAEMKALENKTWTQTHAFLEQIDSMRTTCENIRLLQRELWNLGKPAGTETIPASVGLRTAFHTVEELIKMEKQFKSLSRSMIEPLMSKENFEALFPHLVEDGKK